MEKLWAKRHWQWEEEEEEEEADVLHTVSSSAHKATERRGRGGEWVIFVISLFRRRGK